MVGRQPRKKMGHSREYALRLNHGTMLKAGKIFDLTSRVVEYFKHVRKTGSLG